MTIEEEKTIDMIGVSKSDGSAVLGIADHLPWSTDGRHLVMLQAKINSYLSFIESGELYTKYPDASGRKICIQLVCKHQPHGVAIDFLQRAGLLIKRAGYTLAVHHLANDGDA